MHAGAEVRRVIASNVLAIGFSCDGARTRRRTRRLKHDWVRGEVHCLMCARLVGRLLGSLDGAPERRYSSLGTSTFFAYRAAAADAPVVAYRTGVALRCTSCGGAGTVDDVDFLSTYDEQPGAFDHDDILRRRRGRPTPRREDAAAVA
jgi:hypothetical protein